MEIVMTIGHFCTELSPKKQLGRSDLNRMKYKLTSIPTATASSSLAFAAGPT